MCAVYLSTSLTSSSERQLIGSYLNHDKIFHNILWFQPLKCDDLLLFLLVILIIWFFSYIFSFGLIKILISHCFHNIYEAISQLIEKIISRWIHNDDWYVTVQNSTSPSQTTIVLKYHFLKNSTWASKYLILNVLQYKKCKLKVNYTY